MNKEQVKKWLPLGAAGVLGLAAAGIGWTLVTQMPAGESDGRARVELDTMLVAARPLPAGTALNEDDLLSVRLEAGSRPVSAFEGIGALLTSDTPVVTTAFVPAGAPLLAEHLSTDASVGLAALIPEGQRAYTMHVDLFTGLGNFLQPEASVDIVATMQGEDGAVVRTIVQNARVLAVDGRTAGTPAPGLSDENYVERDDRDRSVTLVVTPEQAARIELASVNGQPRLVLRSAIDKELSPFEGLTLGDLLGTRPEPTDPWAGYYAEAREPAVDVTLPPERDSGVAAVDARDIDSPGTADPVSRTPTTRPNATPRPHVVEVIRGGQSTRTPVGPEAAPTPESDPARPAD
jgi:Flp pilus assembly protein CpaB